MLNTKYVTFRPIAWKAVCLCLCALVIDFRNVIFAGQHHMTTDYGYTAKEAVTGENARVLLLTENFNSAVAMYARLLAKDSTNVSLSSEYAYALALNGIYDAALIRLDRIWNLKAGNKEIDYFASQVFALMGHDRLAEELWKGSGIAPSWISAKAPELLQKRKRKELKPAASGRDELVTLFKQANRMTAQNQSVQSIVLFEEITNQYPNEYLPYVGYSIALEKAGFLEKSAQTIEAALRIVGNNPDQTETKQFLDQRLLSIRNKINTPAQKIVPNATGDNGPRMIAHAGGFIAKSYTSINARFGNYFSKTSFVSADLGATSISGQSFVNFGLSVFNRQGIFVEGFGISAAIGNDSPALFGKLSVGVSFMNKSRTSSLDIFLDGRLPMTKGGVTTVGLSVGQSIYFGKRK